MADIVSLPNNNSDELSEIPDDVKSLIVDIQCEIDTRKQSVQRAVAQEKLLMHHRIGELIKVHLMQNEERAGYGEKLIPLLVRQLGMGQSELYASIQFYESYPQILRSSGELTWTHMRTVLTLKNKVQQRKMIQKIESEKLSVRDMKYLIKQEKNPDSAIGSAPLKDRLAPPQDRGTPYTYRLERDAGELKINLGFGFRIESPDKNLNTNSVITSEKTGQKYQLNVKYLRLPILEDRLLNSFQNHISVKCLRKQ